MSSFSPVVTATIQAAVLSATSNLLAQALTAYRDSKPLAINFTPLFHFTIYALLNTPPNVLWQNFLEATFPSQVPARAPRHAAAAASEASAADVRQMDEKELNAYQHPKRDVVPMQLSWSNTLAKFALDQTLGAVVNTVAFIAGMAMLRGVRDQGQIWETVKTDTWPLMAAGLKLWPLVSLLSFTVIPPSQRIVFGSVVGVAWGVFLSLFAGH